VTVDPQDAERAIRGLSERTLIVLVVVVAAPEAEPRRVRKALKLPRWRMNRMLRRLTERGLLAQRDEGTVHEATALGQRAALLAAWTTGIADFEPDRLADLRQWDRKAPFPRGRVDDLL